MTHNLLVIKTILLIILLKNTFSLNDINVEVFLHLFSTSQTIN